jgi:polysaccharide export outer membrane protein
MRLSLSRRRISWWQMAMGLLLVMGLTACGSMGRYPAAPAVAASSGHVYKIGPLDVIQVVVWQQADLSGRVTVRPDGRISLPLVEDLQAAGRTPVELARDIEKLLTKFIQGPQVTVQMQGKPGAASEQIRVGGLTDFADGNGAVLVRGAEHGTQYSLRLKDLLRRGDMSANIEVIPGDVIIVPQAVF